MMLIPFSLLSSVFRVTPKRVLHVGAHEAEEYQDYLRAGCEKIVWVEAQAEKVQQLRSRFKGQTNISVLEAAVWDIDGLDVTLYVTNMTQSSSLLPLGTHLESYPSIQVEQEIPLQTSRLDSILHEDFDFLALDIQGAELRALKGFSMRLEKVTWIYTEVNKTEVYKGASQIDELDEFLRQFGLHRVATRWTHQGWGDALYIKNRNWTNFYFRFITTWIPSQIIFGIEQILHRVLVWLRGSILKKM